MRGTGAAPGRTAGYEASRRLSRADYANSCAPAALSALTGVSRHAAARVLKDVGDVVGHPPGPETTSLTTLLWALWGLGCRLTAHDPATGEETLDDARLRALQRRLVCDGSRRCRAGFAGELPRGMRLAAWLAGPGSEGRWAVAVHPPDRRQHVLALAGGAIVAGDPAGTYGPARLLAAYFVQPLQED